MIFQDRFKPLSEPKRNIGEVHPESAFATFTQAFDHPDDPDVRASPAAVQRYLQDGRTFPAFAYESSSLLWKDDSCAR